MTGSRPPQALGVEAEDFHLEATLKHQPDEESICLLPYHDKPLEDANEDYSHDVKIVKRDARTIVLSYARYSLNFVRLLVLFLVPSFISSRWDRAMKESHTLRPTAFLDGLRGVAAWSVFNAHLSATIVKDGGSGWGHGGTNYQPWKFPGITLMYKGDFAVGLFFVISGFALSISPIAAMRKSPRDPAATMCKLASSTLRRPIRLFLPSFASCFLTFVLLRLHYFSALQARMPEFNTVVNGWQPLMTEWPPTYPTFTEQLISMLKNYGNLLKVFVNPVDPSFEPEYNGVLWTVKMECRASLILYITHAAVYYMRPKLRTAITLALITIGFSVHSYDVPLFWTGYLIAEYDRPASTTAAKGTLLRSAWWVTFILGVYIGSYPGWDTLQTPMYAWLAPMTPFGFVPPERFWTGIGAVLIVLSFSKLPLLQSIYSYSFIQYLGKISFALYLVHFAMVSGLGTFIFFNVWTITGKESFMATFLGFCIGYCLLLSSVIIAADIFWRGVDKPSVSFALTVEKWFFEREVTRM